MDFLMVTMASGFSHGCICTRMVMMVVGVETWDDGDHTLATRSTETCSLGL